MAHGLARLGLEKKPVNLNGLVLLARLIFDRDGLVRFKSARLTVLVIILYMGQVKALIIYII